MIKAIFFDIDGTLISFNTHKMPATTKAALQVLRSKGIKLFIATGRSLQTIPGSDVLGFDFDGYVTFNGQFCIEQQQILHEQYLPVKDLETILTYINKHQIACQFMELEYEYYNVIDDRVLALFEYMGNSIPRAPVDNTDRIFTHKVYQICAFISEEEEGAFFEVIPGCKAVRWNSLFVDVIPKAGGKDVGLQKVLDYYGFEREQCMAIGDGGNDIDMIKYAGVGVAMGNASNKVKAVADYVTDDVDRDGILKALQHFGLC